MVYIIWLTGAPLNAWTSKYLYHVKLKYYFYDFYINYKTNYMETYLFLYDADATMVRAIASKMGRSGFDSLRVDNFYDWHSSGLWVYKTVMSTWSHQWGS